MVILNTAMVMGTPDTCGTGNLPDSSYYLMDNQLVEREFVARISLPFVTGSGGSNPAFDRYAAGGSLTVCERSITTRSLSPGPSDYVLYPNPASRELFLRKKILEASTLTYSTLQFAWSIGFENPHDGSSHANCPSILPAELRSQNS